MVELNVWVCYDADGDWRVGTDEDAAREAYTDEVGGECGRRMVKLTLSVPLPAIIEIAATVPQTEGAATVSVS